MESWGKIPLNPIKQFHKVLSKCLYLRKRGFSPADVYTFGLVVFKCLTSSYDGQKGSLIIGNRQKVVQRVLVMLRSRLENNRFRITSRVPPGTTLHKKQSSNVLLT